MVQADSLSFYYYSLFFRIGTPQCFYFTTLRSFSNKLVCTLLSVYPRIEREVRFLFHFYTTFITIYTTAKKETPYSKCSKQYLQNSVLFTCVSPRAISMTLQKLPSRYLWGKKIGNDCDYTSVHTKNASMRCGPLGFQSIDFRSTWSRR